MSQPVIAGHSAPPCADCDMPQAAARGTRTGTLDSACKRSQARPRIFDLEIDVPNVLYEEVVEVDEEVILPLGEEPDRCGPASLPLAMQQGMDTSSVLDNYGG